VFPFLTPRRVQKKHSRFFLSPSWIREAGRGALHICPEEPGAPPCRCRPFALGPRAGELILRPWVLLHGCPDNDATLRSKGARRLGLPTKAARRGCH